MKIFKEIILLSYVNGRYVTMLFKLIKVIIKIISTFTILYYLQRLVERLDFNKLKIP